MLCVSKKSLLRLCLWTVLYPDLVSRIQFLRSMKEFLQLTFKVEGKKEELEELEDGEQLSRLVVTLSCVGVGYSNFNKGIM